MTEALALIALAATLAAAVTRPRWAPDWAVAAGAAVLLVVIGALSADDAGDALGDLGPTVGFLVALLILADGCRRAGLFDALGAAMASGSGGSARRLLAMVFLAAGATTAVLSLDATVVLLTPVVFATAARLRVDARPHVYACSHLANSASLLLPVSNLTNLLAFQASSLSFTRFAALMVLPWLAALAVEWTVLSRAFAGELTHRGAPARPGRSGPGAAREPSGQAAAPAGEASRGAAAPARAPSGEDAAPAREPSGQPAAPTREASRGAAAAARSASGQGAAPARRGAESRGAGSAHRTGPVLPLFPLVVLGATLAGFALSSLAGVSPLWVAAVGAVALAARARPAPAELLRAAEPAFLVFVLGLGVVVRAASDNGLESAVDALLPHGGGLWVLLAIAAVSALVANLVNNLPATLIVLPVAAASGPGAVLAMLIGVNVGPNLTYAGSLATLLWRRVLHAHDTDADLGEFVQLGALTVPPALIASTVALWLALQVV